MTSDTCHVNKYWCLATRCGLIAPAAAAATRRSNLYHRPPTSIISARVRRQVMSIGQHQTSIAGIAALPLDAACQRTLQ